MQEDELNYRRFLDGDLEGFENLVLSYKNKLIYFILRYIKDFDLAEDLAQDVFVDVYVHKERYRLQTNFKTYLFTIGRNKAVDYIRKYGRETSYDLSTNLEFELNYRNSYVGKSEEKSPEDWVIKEEESKTILTAMDDIKQDYKIVLLLIGFEGLSYHEAAQVMGKTQPQIKILVYRARKALQKALVKGGYIDEK